MAIGTLAAIGIGLAGVGSALGASSQKKAAKTAANAQTYAADQSAAVQREQLGIAQDALNPFVQRGNAAGNQINALLGLGGPATVSAATLPTPQPMQAVNYNALAEAKPWLFENNPNGGPAYLQFQDAARTINGQPMQPQMTAQGGQSPQQAAQNAFDIFRNSTGYQFRLGQGMDAINGGYAGAGTLQSGAALKAINDYGQNMASQEFGNYLGYLGNQQGVGLSGGSALAGVGQNFANSLTAINDNRASAIGNAALVRGNNNPFANALGMVGGGLLGYGR